MNETQTRPNTNYIDGNRAEQLLEKWSPVLDYTSNKVSAIKDSHTRLNTAMLLENQEKWCLEEANTSSGGALGTSVASIGQGGSGGYSSTDAYAQNDSRLPKILIPMIRRTFPELITNEIVGVQPMSGPVGLAFALRYKYGTTNLSGGALTSPQSLAGTNTAQQQTGKTGEAGYQNLDSRFTGASSSDVASLSWTASDGVADGLVFAGQDAGMAEALASFELDNAANMPTLELSFEKTAVEAGTRRLGARWSVELEQDLKNMNGIDVDSELTNAMSYEIQAEIDREMIIRMIQAALGGTSGQHFSTFNVASADGRWMAERNRAVYQKLIIEANRMAVRNRRGAANFIVATPRVCSILEMLPEFSWMTVEGNVNTAPIGVAKVGNVGGRFNVYRDTRTESQYNLTATDAKKVEYALLGYKGPEYYDSGIIYCPYIPVMIQRTIDPNGFYPKVGLLTRYGVVDHLFGAENYYHVCFITGMNIATGASELKPYA
tara:strand:+ start:204 stop:1676 length:1473 start_codon:yes stop_codon:yes gene_type:complete